MIAANNDFILLLELADVLTAHALHRCSLTVDVENEVIQMTVTIPPDGLDTTELGQQLLYLAGLCQVRAFATHYGIDAAALERLLPRLP